MKTTFTGTESHAAAYSLESVDDDNLYIKHTLTCRLNDKNKKDLTEFKLILDEFKNKELPLQKDVIVISVKNKLSPNETMDLFSDANTFMKKFRPKGDSISINGIESKKSKNHIYIMKKLQELLSDIKQINDVELLLPASQPDRKQISISLFETTNTSNREIRESLKPRNIKLNTDIIFESIGNTIKKIR